MTEQTSNVEFARKIHEQGHHHRAGDDRSSRWVELAEAIVLAVVAVATAWSGYQATKWDALSDQNYSLASRTTVMAQEKVTLAWKDRLYDIVTFNGWVAAENAGNKKLATLYEHRFRPECAVAILAWQKLDPLKNVSRREVPSSSGSIRMRPTGNPRKLIEEAKRYFEKAVKARETGDHYVKVSVFLATLGQRFEMSGPRIVVLDVAFTLLIISTFWIVTFPRA